MHRIIGKRIPRDDAVAKATGRMKFFADYKPQNCLHGAVHRAAYPHAKILAIHSEKALAVAGVVDVITWKDIPGLNLFGIGALDQPVLCQDKTRFIGDSIAVVVAQTEAIARKAAALVEVEYEPLPLVTDVFRAKGEESPKVQGETNVASHFTWQTGDAEKYFTDEYIVVEGEYQTQYQEHAYLETEVGFASPTEDGGVEIWAPAQYPYRDIWQLSKILNIPEKKIRCHANPIGGGFGGKDDMAMQPLVAVAAMKLGRTVRIQLNREESFLYSTKRVPFTFRMKTSADKNGKLMAHKVETYGDVGPFTGISVAVFNYGVENACGAYYFPNIDILGEAVFTNNAHTGSFRGFGNNQLNWGLETQLDKLADRLGMDRLELRARNLTRSGQRLSYGHEHEGCDGLIDSFAAAKNSWLWTHQEEFKKGAAHPWLKRGVGIASGQHGNGLGNALRDEGMARIQLQPDGSFVVYVAMVDMGQGLMTTCHMIAAEQLQLPLEQVSVVLGETELSPDAGPTTASRSTYVAGNAICDAARRFCDGARQALQCRYKEVVWGAGGICCDGKLLSWKEIYPLLQQDLRQTTGKCVVPVTDLHIQIGLHKMHTHVTQITGVEVNTLTGKVDVIATELLPAAGTVINRIGYEGQCEGGIAMAMGYAVMEDYQFGKDARPLTKNLQTYLVPTIQDIPRQITITPMEAFERTGPFGAKGLGEPVTIPGAPAITNAIRDAVGITICQLPASPERVLQLLQEKKRDAGD